MAKAAPVKIRTHDLLQEEIARKADDEKRKAEEEQHGPECPLRVCHQLAKRAGGIGCKGSNRGSGVRMRQKSCASSRSERTCATVE